MLAARIHRFGSIDDLCLDTVPDPVPDKDEVVVEIVAIGLNRADTEFIKGVYGGAPRTDAISRDARFLPWIPGIEPVGRIAAVGGGVSDARVGDRVLVHSHFSCGHCSFCRDGLDNFCPEMRVLGTQTPGKGAFAERLAVPRDLVLPLPDDLDFVKAATIGVQASTVWWMMRHRADIRAGNTVLVQGAAGGIGIAALQVSRFLGAIPIGVTRSSDKAAALEKAGAEQVIIDEPEDSIAQRLRLLRPEGVDVVIETVGGNVWGESVESVRQGGKIIVCGGHAGAVVPFNLGHVFTKQMTILGSARAPKWAVEETIRLVATGDIAMPVDRVFPFHEIKIALHRLDQGRHIGKIVVATGRQGILDAAA